MRIKNAYSDEQGIRGCLNYIPIAFILSLAIHEAGPMRAVGGSANLGMVHNVEGHNIISAPDKPTEGLEEAS